MYKKGEVSIGNIWGEENQIHLPHSCDEWVIGGVEEAEQLIEDLRVLVNHLRGK